MQVRVRTHEGNDDVAVTVSSDGTATIGDLVVNLTPGGRHGLYYATVNGEHIPVIVQSDDITTVRISVNGYTYEYDVLEEQHFELLRILSASPAARSRVMRVTAPMPGLLKAIHVVDGQSVRRGDILFTLEAMKMENAIKAPAAGTISHCLSQPGVAVEKGLHLCSIEPA
ncbi:MAG: biotin/lipoyl-binding protein [Candidatus Kapabacteria bacterium]|jgi:biotin carboxyl carrier protein|nr:biotin/lipoyl-binding protein [Candidatus Kapabacteria bacterium]